MLLKLNQDQIAAMVTKQIGNLFVYNVSEDEVILRNGVSRALAECEYCFSFSKNKYYKKERRVFFDPFHSGQYCIFLYFLSRTVWKEGHNDDLASKIYYLNKIFNSVDLYYEVDLPSIFGLDHPLGSVMGRARYSNYFFFTQGCTVGNIKGKYPVIEENVSMYAGSKILGDVTIGSNCIIGANAFIKDQDIPSCSVVFGQSPNLVIKHKDPEYFLEQANRWEIKKNDHVSRRL
jgi:serine O-acetyltransferase